MRVPRVLVVDDQPAIREIFTVVLGGAGCDVRAAGHAEAACRLVDQEPFDLALLDVRLPGADGWSVLAYIRLRRPEMRVLIISDERYEQLARFHHADAFLAKPYRMDTLRDRVDRLLGRSEHASGPDTPRRLPDG